MLVCAKNSVEIKICHFKRLGPQWNENTNQEIAMSHIQSVLTDKVLSITINRLDKKNALTLQMYADLGNILLDAAGNDNVHVVTLTGGEDCFSAGNDLHDFVCAGPLNDQHPVVQFLKIISTFEKPIIAGVAGHAVGIGTTLLMHCDMVYARDTTIFRLPFVNLGLCPEGGSSLLLPNLTGYHKAAELLMFGESFGAVQAFEFGLVNNIIADKPIVGYICERAAQLAALPYESVMATKRLLKVNQGQLANTLDREIDSFERLLNSTTCQGILKALTGGQN
jgi:enoyl-CoA hydratase/carnithine racemase